MEIWVRTQDREFLKLCNEFRICQKLDYGKVIGYSIDCFDVELGWYKTKEKALEVINDLAIHICNIKETELMAQYIKRNNRNFIGCVKYVFNMPKDK